jgi:hypothetical protein
MEAGATPELVGNYRIFQLIGGQNAGLEAR